MRLDSMEMRGQASLRGILSWTKLISFQELWVNSLRCDHPPFKTFFLQEKHSETSGDTLRVLLHVLI